MYTDPFEKLLDKYDLQVSQGCNEPGYDDKQVITGNWNNIPQKVYDALELMGYSCEWLDEWVECQNCYKSVRCQPDSYGWSQYYFVFDSGDLHCGDCIKKYPEEYLERLTNDPTLCDTLDLDLENLGYELVEDDFEDGFYHRNDNPKKILEKLLQNDPDGKYIFRLDGSEQFRILFSVYRKVK